ncbi:hypothetical protein BBJ28_00026041 [Nothophytophthora sp. Chile5]|nr:hypothetical protein BBJ28_00026041 [Nothophytophthora sp. Chile5]
MVSVDSDDDDEELQVQFSGRSGSTTDGYLLTEIFLATSNIVTDVEIESSAEVIFEENVLVSSNTNEELQLKASDASVVFVSAASTAMALQDLKLELSDSASLQFSMDSITVREDAQLQAHGASTITVLTSAFTVDDLDLDAENAGTICISAEDLTAGSYDGEAASKISLPNASTQMTVRRRQLQPHLRLQRQTRLPRPQLRLKESRLVTKPVQLRRFIRRTLSPLASLPDYSPLPGFDELGLDRQA